jgi:hypothetical protein
MPLAAPLRQSGAEVVLATADGSTRDPPPACPQEQAYACGRRSNASSYHAMVRGSEGSASAGRPRRGGDAGPAPTDKARRGRGDAGHAGRPRREYFYFVDRDGSVYHDGTLQRDGHFLRGFLKRLRSNDTGRWPDYPFVSPCGDEMNYVRGEDRVVVFRRLTPAGALEYGLGLVVPFEPGQLRASAAGRLYHPSPVGEYGLLRSALVVQLAERIEEVAGGGLAYRSGEALLPIQPLPE